MQKIAFLAVCSVLFVGYLHATDVRFIELKFAEMKDEHIYSPAVFFPDGEKIIIGSQYFVTKVFEHVSHHSQAGVTRIFDVDSGKELQRWEGSFGGVTSDGKRIAIVTIEDITLERTVCDVRILDINSGMELLKIDDAIFNDFSPDGKKIIVRKVDNNVEEIRILNIESGKELQKIKGVSGAKFSPNGKQLLATLPLYGQEKEIPILDAESGKELKKLEGVCMWGFSHGFSPNGKQIVTQSVKESSPTTLIWDAESGEKMQKLEGFFWGFSRDGKKIVTLREFPLSDTARIWDSKSGKELQRMEEHVNTEPSLVFSSDEKIWFPFGLYNTDQSKVWQGFRHTGEARPVTCSPDGKKIVTVEDNKIVRILTVE